MDLRSKYIGVRGVLLDELLDIADSEVTVKDRDPRQYYQEYHQLVYRRHGLRHR